MISCFFLFAPLKKQSFSSIINRLRQYFAASPDESFFNHDTLLKLFIFTESGTSRHDRFSSRFATFPHNKLPWLYERINPGTLANPKGPPQSEKSLLRVNIDQLLVSQVTVSEFNYRALCQHHSAQTPYIWLLLS